MKRGILRHFLRQERGATAVEFALVAVPFFLLLLGIIEYGLYTFTKVSLESIAAQAGQQASVQNNSGGCDRICVARNYITAKAAGLINYQSVTVTPHNVTVAGGTTFRGDKCLCYPDHIGGPCPCGHYENLGGGPGYDSGPVAYSTGRSGDLIELQVTYPWHVINPIMQPFFSPGGTVVMRVTTTVKNQ